MLVLIVFKILSSCQFMMKTEKHPKNGLKSTDKLEKKEKNLIILEFKPFLI